MNPIFIQKYLIYDVFYNDLNQYVLISPKINNYNISIKLNNKIHNLKLISCEHNHTNIYISNSNELIYSNIIDIVINNDICENIKVNKYLNLENKILMSTIVKNEDKYICQWIEYHKFLGVQHFIIYDNSNSNTLSQVLKKYIDENIVILINWQYPYILNQSGISGQTTQQNHSIYAFKTAKYIGLMDVDEYVNSQVDKKNINDIFDDLINSNNINTNNIGGFELVSRFFLNKQNKPVDKYNFLKIINCGDFFLDCRQKLFVIPKNVDVFSVHMIVTGKDKFTVPKEIMYFNHYIFLNKPNLNKYGSVIQNYNSNYNDFSIIKTLIEFDKKFNIFEKK